MYSKEQFFCSRAHNRVLVEHDHRMFLVVCILKELSFHTPNRPFFRLNIQLHLKRYNETRISFRQMMIFLLLFLLLLIYLRIYIPWGMRYECLVFLNHLSNHWLIGIRSSYFWGLLIIVFLFCSIWSHNSPPFFSLIIRKFISSVKHYNKWKTKMNGKLVFYKCYTSCKKHR